MKHETFPPALEPLDVPGTALLGTFADGSALTMETAALSAPHTFAMGGTGAGKSSFICRRLELAHAEDIPFVVVDPEGQYGPLRDSCPGAIVIGGEDGDVPLSIESITDVAATAFRNHASIVVRLDGFSLSDQRKVVAKVLRVLMRMQKKYWSYRLVVVDEVHLFAPQRGRCESSHPIAEVAARGRRRGLRLVLATQRFARVDKDTVTQCGNLLVGKIDLSADLVPAAEALGLNRQEARRLLELDRGTFIARGPDLSVRPVEVRIRKPRTVLEGTLETRGTAAGQGLTGEALVAALLVAANGGASDAGLEDSDDIATGSGPSAGQGRPVTSASPAAGQRDGIDMTILSLLASSPGRVVLAAALALLLRADATRAEIDAALADLRHRKLIAGRKALVMTAAGKDLLVGGAASSRIFAERIGAIRLALPKDALRALDALAAAGQLLPLSEIARRTGSAERSRKLRNLLARLARAGLVRKQRDLFAISHGYAALAGL